jgi:hypothetical protein
MLLFASVDFLRELRPGNVGWAIVHHSFILLFKIYVFDPRGN